MIRAHKARALLLGLKIAFHVIGSIAIDANACTFSHELKSIVILHDA